MGSVQRERPPPPLFARSATFQYGHRRPPPPPIPKKFPPPIREARSRGGNVYLEDSESDGDAAAAANDEFSGIKLRSFGCDKLGRQYLLPSRQNKKAVLSHGEPHDAAVNLDTIERYNAIVRAVFLPQHGFLAGILSAECSLNS